MLQVDLANRGHHPNAAKKILINKIKELNEGSHREAHSGAARQRPLSQTGSSTPAADRKHSQGTNQYNVLGFERSEDKRASVLREANRSRFGSKDGDRLDDSKGAVNGRYQEHSKDIHRRGTSERRHAGGDKKENKENNAATSGMKVHKGPLNLSTVSMKNPLELMRSLCLVVEELGVRLSVTSKFSIKCEKGSIKFSSEINMIENLDNLFTIKFYKSSGDSIKYANLCNAIFSKMAL